MYLDIMQSCGDGSEVTLVNICHLRGAWLSGQLDPGQQRRASLCIYSFPIHDHIRRITDVLNQPELHKEMVSTDD